MKDTFGPISETPLAFYDHDSLSWRMSQGTLAWEPPPSLGILPASGMTHNGQLYELPPLVPPTSGTDGSVLLPTPTASQPGGTPERHVERKRDAGMSHNAVTDLRMRLEDEGFGGTTGQRLNDGNEC